MTTWWSQAACAGTDPDAFFQGRDDVVPTQARRICATCPVRLECLDTALRTKVDGFWAGTTRKQRDHIRAELGIDADPVVNNWDLTWGHGTAAGAKRHYKAGEPLCEPCRAAAALTKAIEKERRRKRALTEAVA